MRALHPGELAAYASRCAPYPIDAHLPFSIGNVTFSTLREALGTHPVALAVAAQIQVTPYLQRLLITWHGHYDPYILSTLPENVCPIRSDTHQAAASHQAPDAGLEREITVLRTQLEECRSLLVKSKRDLIEAEAERDAASLMVPTYITPRPVGLSVRTLYGKDLPTDTSSQTDAPDLVITAPCITEDREIQVMADFVHRDTETDIELGLVLRDASVGPDVSRPVYMTVDAQTDAEAAIILVETDAQTNPGPIPPTLYDTSSQTYPDTPVLTLDIGTQESLIPEQVRGADAASQSYTTMLDAASQYTPCQGHIVTADTQDSGEVPFSSEPHSDSSYQEAAELRVILEVGNQMIDGDSQNLAENRLIPETQARFADIALLTFSQDLMPAQVTMDNKTTSCALPPETANAEAQTLGRLSPETAAVALQTCPNQKAVVETGVQAVLLREARQTVTMRGIWAQGIPLVGV
jgi:hypothetical protein